MHWWTFHLQKTVSAFAFEIGLENVINSEVCGYLQLLAMQLFGPQGLVIFYEAPLRLIPLTSSRLILRSLATALHSKTIKGNTAIKF